MELILERDDRYRITDAERTAVDGRNYCVKWKCRNGDYLLAVFAIGASVTDEKAWIEEHISEDLVETKVRKEEEGTLFFLKEAVFLANHKSFAVDRTKCPGGALKIRVFACKKEDRGYQVFYEKETEQNTIYIPQAIRVKLKYKNIFLNPMKKCSFTIDGDMTDYVEGAVGYRPSSSRYSIPISSELIRSRAEIQIPRADDLLIQAEEEYKNIYKVNVEEDE